MNALQPYHQDSRATLYLADCRKLLASMPDSSVDSIVTDPPYETGFMGRKWDSSGIAYNLTVWEEALRVLKPGGYLLAFSASRTYHRMTCAIEDTGFEVRDNIARFYSGDGDMNALLESLTPEQAELFMRALGRPSTLEWVYGSGFPKSLNCGNGRGTALKPAHEPICLARKPPIGTVAANILLHGTGAINVDACRVSLGTDKPYSYPNGRGGEGCFGIESLSQNLDIPMEGNALGRWPANLIHDGSDEVLAAFPDAKGQQGDLAHQDHAVPAGEIFGQYGPKLEHKKRIDDTKSAARFFYCAKASKADRDEGLEEFATVSSGEMTGGRAEGSAGLENPRAGAGRTSGRKNFHPTVKPTELMRYLCRLVTPEGGTVLDFFAGSGSTGKAAMLEGFKFVGCDMTPEYMPIMQARIVAAQK